MPYHYNISKNETRNLIPLHKVKKLKSLFNRADDSASAQLYALRKIFTLGKATPSKKEKKAISRSIKKGDTRNIKALFGGN